MFLVALLCLSVCLLATLLKNLQMAFGESCRIARQRYKE